METVTKIVPIALTLIIFVTPIIFVILFMSITLKMYGIKLIPTLNRKINL